MPALTGATRALARSWTAHSLPITRAGTTAIQSRSVSEASTGSSFDSPFKGTGSSTKIPSFAAYKARSGSEETPKLVQYFMVGTMGALTALGAKATVQGMSIVSAIVELEFFKRSMCLGGNDWISTGCTALQLDDKIITFVMNKADIDRLSRQHVCFRRRAGTGQGRD